MNKKVVIFGASGHAKSIAVVLESLNYQIIGFIDSFLPSNTEVLKYRTLGNEHLLRNCFENFGTNNIVIGIGSISDRKEIVKLINNLNKNIEFPTIISPYSNVASYTNIGKGTVVLGNASINVESSIGEFCIISSSSNIEHNSIIGDYCNISPCSNIGAYVSIKSSVFIGASSTIIQKKTIGENSVIGAGAVVISDIPNDVLALGIPATIRKEKYQNKDILK